MNGFTSKIEEINFGLTEYQEKHYFGQQMTSKEHQVSHHLYNKKFYSSSANEEECYWPWTNNQQMLHNTLKSNRSLFLLTLISSTESFLTQPLAVINTKQT